MPCDGWVAKNMISISNQQQHGELEDSVDIRWSGPWSGCHRRGIFRGDSLRKMNAGYKVARDIKIR